MKHTCHARGCNVETKPEMLMCLPHWRMVPPALKKEVWAHYRHGQCDNMFKRGKDAGWQAVPKKHMGVWIKDMNYRNHKFFNGVVCNRLGTALRKPVPAMDWRSVTCKQCLKRKWKYVQRMSPIHE